MTIQSSLNIHVSKAKTSTLPCARNSLLLASINNEFSASYTDGSLSRRNRESLLCDVCEFVDPILCLPQCGHKFHSRCCHTWPLLFCPKCDASVSSVKILDEVDMDSKPSLRSGKWSKEEEDFVHIITKEFDTGRLPVANGTPVRLLLAKILNCSPMRLSKKFQKNALGKRTFRVPKKSPTYPNYHVQFDKEEHLEVMKKIAKSEEAFRTNVIFLNNDNARSKDDGLNDVRNLRVAVQQFWVNSFIKFSLSIGQAVEGSNARIPQTKTRKSNGKYPDPSRSVASTTEFASSSIRPSVGSTTPIPYEAIEKSVSPPNYALWGSLLAPTTPKLSNRKKRPRLSSGSIDFENGIMDLLMKNSGRHSEHFTPRSYKYLKHGESPSKVSTSDIDLMVTQSFSENVDLGNFTPRVVRLKYECPPLPGDLAP